MKGKVSAAQKVWSMGLYPEQLRPHHTLIAEVSAIIVDYLVACWQRWHHSSAFAPSNKP